MASTFGTRSAGRFPSSRSGERVPAIHYSTSSVSSLPPLKSSDQTREGDESGACKSTRKATSCWRERRRTSPQALEVFKVPGETELCTALPIAAVCGTQLPGGKALLLQGDITVGRGHAAPCSEDPSGVWSSAEPALGAGERGRVVGPWHHVWGGLFPILTDVPCKAVPRIVPLEKMQLPKGFSPWGC